MPSLSPEATEPALPSVWQWYGAARVSDVAINGMVAACLRAGQVVGRGSKGKAKAMFGGSAAAQACAARTEA